MNVIRYDPWGLMNRLNRDADRLLSTRFFGDQLGASRRLTEWVPAVDIQEEENRCLIRADVPGVEPKELDISLEDGVLTLEGKRDTRFDEEKNGVHRVERLSGRFHRRFNLPDTADSESISADYNNGVLVISVPKQPESEPRRIQVKVN